MKVIREESKLKGWGEKHKCTGLGSKHTGCGKWLLTEQDDIFKRRRRVGGKTTTYLSFTCSQCGVTTDINDNMGERVYSYFIPKTIWVNAPSRKEWRRRQAQTTWRTYDTFDEGPCSRCGSKVAKYRDGAWAMNASDRNH